MDETPVRSFPQNEYREIHYLDSIWTEDVTGDVSFIEISGSGKLKWQIFQNGAVIRTGFIDHGTDRAELNSNGIPFLVEIENRERQPFSVYMRVVRPQRNFY